MAIEPVENDPEVIRKQMEQTRESLQDKLETLEQHVTGTVLDATAAINETVETVKDTVETVKENIKDTVVSVKETVKETVGSVKDTFDLHRQVQNHPFLMVGGATVVGFVVGQMVSSSNSTTRNADAVAPVASVSRTSNGHSRPVIQRRSWWDFISQHYGDELDKIKALAIGAAGSLIQEMIVSEFKPEIANEIKDIVAGITTKLGGKPIANVATPERGPEEVKTNGRSEFSRTTHF